VPSLRVAIPEEDDLSDVRPESGKIRWMGRPSNARLASSKKPGMMSRGRRRGLRICLCRSRGRNWESLWMAAAVHHYENGRR